MNDGDRRGRLPACEHRDRGGVVRGKGKPLPAPWRVLPFEVADAESLLGRSTSLLDGLADDPRPALRWYRSSSPALVLGRGQAPASAAVGLPLVVRSSGGGAVLLDDDILSLDVLLPSGHPWLGSDLAAVFDRVGAAWAAALAQLGVPAVTVHGGPSTARRRGTPHEQLLAAICYATLGRGEVLSRGRKLVGLAQRRRRPGALVQCGLLRRWRPATLLRAFGADAGDATVARAAVGLDELLPAPPSDEQVIAEVSARIAG